MSPPCHFQSCLECSPSCLPSSHLLLPRTPQWLPIASWMRTFSLSLDTKPPRLSPIWSLHTQQAVRLPTHTQRLCWQFPCLEAPLSLPCVQSTRPAKPELMFPSPLGSPPCPPLQASAAACLPGVGGGGSTEAVHSQALGWPGLLGYAENSHSGSLLPVLTVTFQERAGGNQSSLGSRGPPLLPLSPTLEELREGLA